ncbi:MAG: ThuA domain-containing protein [Clostridiales bacterium]|jgi:trehalose utilization protein|nr:ThuA domain-containing protein [Clostridiales bacterium]
MIRVTVWTEFDKTDIPAPVAAAYPDGMDGCLGSILGGKDFKVTLANLFDADCGLSEKLLNDTDVLVYWAHSRHGAVPDDAVARVKNEVNKGMGAIFLHSAHHSKAFKALTGASGDLVWREIGEHERLWTATPAHPIAKGVEQGFVIPHEEMYGEPFDIPNPDCTVFLGWYAGGEVFRSGVTFTRGCGKIFYFQPGHETFPVYYQPEIRTILKNAVLWAAPSYRRVQLGCPNIKTSPEGIEGKL